MPIVDVCRGGLVLLGRVARERRLGLLAKKAWALLRAGDFRGLRDKARRALDRSTPPPADAYRLWMDRQSLGAGDLGEISREIAAMARPPRFSVLMPVHEVDERWLRLAIESVMAQIYPHWELCVADDGSTRPHIRPMLEAYAAREQRIKLCFRAERGHISAATNSALALAEGDFVALLDHDDELAPDALLENARVLEAHPDADMIYSDEDKLSPAGMREHPHFKPDWSPELFYSVMYTCHLGVYRTSLVREIGGLREGFEGSQDYDLVLRLMERTSRIHHIPKVLYHWRVIEGSTATDARQKDYTERAAVRALTEHFARRGRAVEVGRGPLPNTYRVRHQLAERPLVSILIPTRDAADLLRRAVESILAKSTYPRYEIVVVDNGSEDPAARRYLDRLAESGGARVARFDHPFNYAALNNFAVRQARGDLLLFLNNDTEVIEAEWIEAMVEHAMQPEVGAVGARLLYPDGRVQHAGVILGLGGFADHAHKHLSRHDVGYYGRAMMIQNFSAVTAACLMMRRALFEEVGGFDEALTVAFNDVDLCLRLRERGYRIVWTPYAELYHHESATRGHEDTADKHRRLLAEVERLRGRWGAALDRDPYYSPHLTLDRYDFSLRPIP